MLYVFLYVSYIQLCDLACFRSRTFKEEEYIPLGKKTIGSSEFDEGEIGRSASRLCLGVVMKFSRSGDSVVSMIQAERPYMAQQATRLQRG